VLLLVAVRPRRRDFAGRDLLACAGLGVVTAVLMLSFMLAVARLPLGTATALEFVGPLAVSVYGQSGARRLWAAAGAVGVVLLTQPWHGGINPAGLAFCLVAAVCWASYILLTQHVGDRVSGLNGLAVSIPVAGAVALAIAGPSLAGRVTWPLAFIMLALAALSLVLPFSLEFLSLRRLTTAAFGTLMSLEPAVALLAGVLVLGQAPGVIPTFGIFFVVAAGIGATRTGARASAAPDGAGPEPCPPGSAPALSPGEQPAASSRLVQGQGDGMQGQAHAGADHGAVNSNELQVPPEQQLKLAGGLLGVPALDRSGNQAGQLVVELVGQRPGP
jgi:inner membrane transporter RhtA